MLTSINSQCIRLLFLFIVANCVLTVFNKDNDDDDDRVTDRSSCCWHTAHWALQHNRPVGYAHTQGMEPIGIHAQGDASDVSRRCQSVGVSRW